MTEVSDVRDVHVGQDRATLESARLVRGRGQHVGDLAMSGLLEVAMVRSPHAHARIVAVDVGAARRAPGVHAVLTGEDVARESTQVVTMAASHRPPLPIPVFGLAVDKARFEGEAVVAVAATTRALAEAAARLVEVTYEVLAPIVTIDQAMDPDLPAIHEGLGGNVIMHRHYDFGDVDGAFATAAHVVSRRITWPRNTGSPMETFGCVAQWKPEGPGVEFWSNHHSFALISSLGPTLGLEPQQVRAHAMDVGGSFGGKFWVPRPMVVCALLSKHTGRPVRFVEDRTENLEAGENHGEDRVYDAELALDAGGVMTGLRFTVLEDYGASFILGPIGIAEPLAQIVGPYRIQAVGVDFTALATNKTAQTAYRGFGTAAQNFMLERLVDGAADELGWDPVELRRHNFIATEDFPYRTPTGNVYDSGDYFATLDLALDKADIATWRERQAAARLEGRAIGIGVATCNERSVQGGSALWLMFDQDLDRPSTSAETVTVRIDPAGRVRIALHSPSLGTSPETVAATVAAEELGLRVEDVVVSRLTSDVTGPSLGPSASRLTVMVAGAVSGAAKELLEKLRPLAARRLGTLPGLVRYDRASASYVTLDQPSSGVDLASLALEANTAGMNLPEGFAPGLETTFTFDHPYSTMPKSADDWGIFAPIMGHAVHVPVVEVDVETGVVHFLAYTVIHDCGTVLNPQAVRGQVMGAICQGVGSTFGELLTYDETGHLVERDLRSFLLTTTIDMPEIDLHHVVTPSPFTWRGVKGVGEGGRITAPAAIASAVEDALRPWGAQITSVPLTPEMLIDVIDGADGAGGDDDAGGDGGG